MHLNRVPRFVFFVVAAVAAAALGASAASAGNGSTVLRGQFDTYADFVVNGTDVFFTFTCDEQRVQKPDGSASESATCHLDPGQTAPSTAAPLDSSLGYISDFFFFGPVPGFAGGSFTYDVHGVLTPSGNVNFSTSYAA